MGLSELVGIDIDHITDMLSVIGKEINKRTIHLDSECIKVINTYLNVRPDITGEKALFLSEENKGYLRGQYKVWLKVYGEAG